MVSNATPFFIKQPFFPSHSPLPALPSTSHKQFFVVCTALGNLDLWFSFRGPFATSLGNGSIYYFGFLCVLLTYPVQPSQINKCIVFLLATGAIFPGPTQPQRAAHMSNDHSMKTWNHFAFQPGSLCGSVRQQLYLQDEVARVSLNLHFYDFLPLLKPHTPFHEK